MGHTTDDYKSGGITMDIAKWTGSTPPDEADLVDVGNVVTYSTEPKIIKKPHVSHRGATAKTDKKVKVGEECMLRFTLDEGSTENLRMYFQGVIDGDGTTIYPMAADIEEYAVRITEHLASGTALGNYWWKVEISAAAALEQINHGDGEGDWQTMEFEGEVLADEINHPGDDTFGKIYVIPTP